MERKLGEIFEDSTTFDKPVTVIVEQGSQSSEETDGDCILCCYNKVCKTSPGMRRLAVGHCFHKNREDGQDVYFRVVQKYDAHAKFSKTIYTELSLEQIKRGLSPQKDESHTLVSVIIFKDSGYKNTWEEQGRAEFYTEYSRDCPLPNLLKEFYEKFPHFSTECPLLIKVRDVRYEKERVVLHHKLS